MRAQLVKSLLGVLAVAGAASALLVSPRTAESLRPTLLHAASRAAGTPIAASELSLSLWPPTLELREFSVGTSEAPQSANADAGPTRVFLRAQNVRLRPALLQSLIGRPALGLLEVQGAAVVAHLGPRAPEAPEAQPTGWAHTPWPIDVIQANLRDVDITVTEGGRSWQALGAALSMQPTHHHERTLHWHWGITFNPGLPNTRALPLTWQGRARLLGPLHTPSALQLDETTVTANRLTATLQGGLPIAPGAPADSLTLGLDGPLGEVAQRLNLRLPMAGTLHLTALISDPFGDPSCDVQARLQNVAWAGSNKLGDLYAEAIMSRRGAVVQRVAWLHGGRTQATLEGRYDFVAPYDFEIKSDWHNAQVAPWVQALTNQPSPITAGLTGKMTAAGVREPALHVAGDIDLRALPFKLVAAPGSLRPPVVHMEQLGLRGHYASTRARTELKNFIATAGPSSVLAEGTLEHGGAHVKEALWSVNFRTEKLDLTHVGPVAGLAYAGQAQAQGRLQGPLLRPQVQGHAKVRGFGLGPILLGLTEADIAFTAPILRLDHAVVTRDAGDLRGDLSIRFTEAGPQLAAALEARGIDLGEVSQTLNVPPTLAAHLHGRLFGPIRLEGPLVRPLGQGTLASPDLRISDVLLGAAGFGLQFGEPGTLVGMTVNAQPQAGRVRGHLRYLMEGDLEGDLTAHALPLSMAPHFAAHNVEGQLNLALNGGTRAHVAHGGATVNIEDLTVDGRPQGSAHLVARAQEQVVTLSASMLRGSAHATGSVTLTPGFPSQLRGGFDALNVTTLLNLVAPALGAPLAEVTAALSGRWTLEGPLANPAKINLTAQVTALQLGWHGMALALRHPVALTLRAQKVHIAQATLKGPLLQLDVSGIMPLSPEDPRLAVTLVGQGDLGLLAAASPAIDSGHGPINVTMSLSETLRAPRIVGEARAQNGSLRLRGQTKALEAVSARALFTGRTMAVTGGEARIGQGTLQFAGEANVGEGTWRHPEGILSLRLKLKRVPLRPAQDVEAVLSGNLELTGGSADNALRGDLRIDQMRYAARIDLDKLVPKRAAPPLRAPMLPQGQAIRLGIRLKAPGNIIVSAPVLDAELAADLTVTGTTDRVGLLGSVRPLWAQARWRDNSYTLTRSSIDFVDEYRIAPQYDVVARTHACQMDADVQIQGSVDGFTVTPSGRDERGIVDPQDVLTCLQFGLRLRDFDGNQRSGATSGAVSSGLDALWTVSGLDAKVRKVLPISVDELRLTSGWSSTAQRTTPRVLVGKDLGHHVALRYSRSIDQYNDQSFSLDYHVAEHASLSAGWLTVRDIDVGDFGLDLRLHWSLR